MANLELEIKKTNERVHFEGISESNKNIVIPFDFAPPIGDGDGFAGLELLLMSFAGCVSTTVVFLLSRFKKHISAFSAKAEGVRREAPLSLKEIHFHIKIESNDITDTEIEEVIKQAEILSPVWQAIKNNVEVKITYDLINA